MIMEKELGEELHGFVYRWEFVRWGPFGDGGWRIGEIGGKGLG